MYKYLTCMVPLLRMSLCIMILVLMIPVRILCTEDNSRQDRPSDEICQERPNALSIYYMWHSPEEHLHEMFSSGSIGENVITPYSDGIHVSIKTTVKYHKIRLPAIILTWLQNISPSQVKSLVTSLLGVSFI